jgi:hypothetical protein
MKIKKINILEANRLLGIMPEERLLKIIEPHALLKEGYSIQDTLENYGERQGE